MRILQIDAFASGPFKGNPAAVCLMEEPRSDGWMQSVAAEMNLAETAFVQPRPDGFSLRWFTPAVEIALCGHATLASAHALWEEGLLDAAEEARFHTMSGWLTAVRDGAWIELDFPATREEPVSPPEGLLQSLGVTAPLHVGRTMFDYLVEVGSEEELRRIQPDQTALRRIPTRGVIVTARSSSAEIDFVSRFFAPAAGIDEDPVTGSAHCALAPYWAGKLGRTGLTGFQASFRGGFVQVRLDGSRVKLRGEAVTVLRGELLV